MGFKRPLKVLRVSIDGIFQHENFWQQNHLCIKLSFSQKNLNLKKALKKQAQKRTNLMKNVNKIFCLFVASSAAFDVLFSFFLHHSKCSHKIASIIFIASSPNMIFWMDLIKIPSDSALLLFVEYLEHALSIEHWLNAP